MSPRDEARRQWWKDLDSAIIEDVYRELWSNSRGWWRRKRRKRIPGQRGNRKRARARYMAITVASTLD